MCGMVPKMCGIVPKNCGMVPKMCGMVPKMQTVHWTGLNDFMAKLFFLFC